MGHSRLRSSFNICLVLLILSDLQADILAARSVADGYCKAEEAIKVKWNHPRDYQTFKLQVENTCRVCDACNVVVHLRMLAPGIWNPVNERVSVKNGTSIRPGEKVSFTYHVNYLADISTAQPSAHFTNCK